MESPSLAPARASPLRAAEERRRAKDSERTAAGCAILAVAVLLGWIPLVGFVGIFLGAVGVVLLLIGSPSFGRRHESLVWAALGLFVLALVAAVILPPVAANAIASMYGYSPDEISVQAAFGFFLYASIGISVLTSLGLALLSVGLLDPRDRVLVALAAVSQVAVTVFLVVFVLGPFVHDAIAQAFSSTPPNVTAVKAANAQLTALTFYTLLDAIPAVLFAVGFFRAFRRVERGAIFPRPNRPPLPWKS